MNKSIFFLIIVLISTGIIIAGTINDKTLNYSDDNKNLLIKSQPNWKISHESLESNLNLNYNTLGNTLELNIQNLGGSGYKFQQAICNISGVNQIEKLEYNPSTEVWSSTGNLQYAKLINYGMPSDWCSETNGYGFVSFSSTSKDKQLRFNFPEGNKEIKIYTGTGTQIDNLVYSDEVANYTLLDNSCIDYRYCQAIIKSDIKESGKLLDNLNFYKVINNELINGNVRNYQIYINTSTGWEIYNNQNVVGEHIWKIEAEKKPSLTIDWIATAFGTELSNWAVWNAPFVGDEYQLVIQADNLNVNGLEINNVIVTNLTSTSWKINTSESDDNLSRAYIMKTLFYGTDGSNPRATNVYITNPTNVYVNRQTDNDHLGYYARVDCPYTPTLTGTFQAIGNLDNSDNNLVSSWSYVQEDSGGECCAVKAYWQVNSSRVNEIANSVNDEIGTDTHLDEYLNATNVYLGLTSSGQVIGGSKSRAIIFTKGNLSWTESFGALGCALANNSFFQNESFPIMKAQEGNVYINSPEDNFRSNSTSVNINCSFEINDGATGQNISFWHNLTGTWHRNQTINLTGTSNSTIFNQNFTNGQGGIIACSVIDSDNAEGFTENNTLNIDLFPQINITNPTGETSDLNITFNVTVTDTNLDYCYYNVTHLTSVDISNTEVNCSDANGNFTLLGDANFTFSFWVNDTSGNSNSSFSYFNISGSGETQPIIIITGGAGGGGTTININESFSIETSTGGTKYSYGMTTGLSKSKTLLFENLGDQERFLEISCKDIGGSLCQYVTFENDSLILEDIKELKIPLEYTITIPRNAEIDAGDYFFNIVARDLKLDISRTLTNEVKVSYGLSTFTTKLFASFKIGDFSFPYILLFLGSSIFISGIILFTIKKSNYRLLIAPLIGFPIGAGLVYII